MAQQGFSEAPSKRFVRAYLVIWAVPAVGALGYLASLAWQPETLATATAPVQPKLVQPDPVLQAAGKALAEIDGIRQRLDELHKDVGGLKETTDQRSEHEKALQSRLAALEEKLAAMPSTVATSVNTPTTGKQKAADKTQPKAAALKAGQLKPGAARVITIEPGSATSAEVPTGTPLETGSIAQAEVVFGEAVVTRAGEVYAVQLDVAPSLDGLRMRWSVLLERYGSTLATLQPRFVAPRTPGAPYRLLAGPLASLADAKGVCGAVRAQLPACSTTDFIGDPL